MAEIGRRKGDAVLLLALAAGQTIRDAARSAGIGERTATRRVADPEFRQRTAELRGQMLQRALGKMADGMADAADTLRGLLASESESVRLGACRAMLELGVKLRESVELEGRFGKNGSPGVHASVTVSAILAAGQELADRLRGQVDLLTWEGSASECIRIVQGASESP